MSDAAAPGAQPSNGSGLRREPGAENGIGAFLLSREGAGFFVILLVAAALSVAGGYAFYRSGLDRFTANKAEESVTALRLVDAFVTTFSGVRGTIGTQAPVPATFRAHSIEQFNRTSGSANVLRLLAAGPAGRSILTPPADQQTADTIAAFAKEAHPTPRSGLTMVGNEPVFRTIYPSIASQQSCVDCHNKLQPSQNWHLNEIMGGTVIDAPVGSFLGDLRLESFGVAGVLFVMSGVFALWISLGHHRRLFEREAVRVRLAASEQRFRDFAESSSDWFWEQDENLLISYVSDNPVSRRLGSTSDDQIGKHRREVVRLGVSDEQWAAHDADQAARRPFQKFRFERIDDTGVLRHIELNGKPNFDEAGRFCGYRGTARDVTVEVATELELTRRVEERTAELRRVQEELLRKERLSTLGQFTATVAHELRNPLSAIRNTAFAIAEAASARGLGLDRPIGRLERSVARCDRLITDLLEYTRMRELKRMPVMLDPWLGEVLDEQKPAEGVAIERDLAAPGLLVEADPDCLRRVVINLVENACQAMAELPPERERRLVLRTRVLAGAVTIAVDDSGPGIPPGVMSRVFDPLFSTKSFGTGLGLPTVKQIVDQHGGTIEIASQPGQGTQVLVTLPRSAVVSVSPAMVDELAA